MARTFGAKDSYKRKRKRLFKNRYRRKHGRLVPYVSKRKRDAPLRLWFWNRVRLDKDAYLRFPRKCRAYMKFKTEFVGRPISVYPDQISTPEKIEQLAVDTIQFTGNFILLMPSHSVNSFHVSYKKKANIKIVETEEGLKAKCFNYSKLSHYWFFRNSR